MGKIKINSKTYYFNENIDIYGDPIKEKSVTIYLKSAINTKDKNPYPCATFNMQENCACFESIAFLIWSEYEDCTVVLKYDVYDSIKGFDSLSDILKVKGYRKLHYTRFLYRVWKMHELYNNRFEIHEDNNKEIDKFSGLYKEYFKEFIYSGPTGEAIININSKYENVLEKWFVMNGIKDELIKCKAGINSFENTLHDQLPCSIFYKNKSNRLFSDGNIDLWGINTSKKEICIFELKQKSNNKLGIISELFFYSCIMKDIIEIGRDEKNSQFRGVQDLWGKKEWNIKAIFLVPCFHRYFIENNRMDSIIKLMNERKDKVEYGYIVYNQDMIDDDGKKEDKIRNDIYENWN